jgi:hypothetical protein
MKFKSGLNILLILALSFTLVSFTSCSNDNQYDMSSLDNDMDDADDFEEYISDAKISARNENFSSAYSYLEKARKLGVSRSELSNAKSYVSQKKEAYEEKIERERQARLERERQERMAQQSQSYSGDSGNSLDYVMVNIECVGWFCVAEKFKLSGGPGNVQDPGNTSSTSIHDIGQGIAGRYSYSAKVGNKYCSGSFNISGARRNVRIGVMESCSTDVNEF